MARSTSSLAARAGRQNGREHTGDDRQYDDHGERENGQPEGLDPFVLQRGHERPTEEHSDHETEQRALERDDHRLPPDHRSKLSARVIPTARIRPSSRVRSKMDRASVLPMPSRAMKIASKSIA